PTGTIQARRLGLSYRSYASEEFLASSGHTMTPIARGNPCLPSPTQVNGAFSDLLKRVRGGDPEAAREIVANYTSAIRVAIRTRLSDRALRRQFDSMDVCQSVFGSFFLRMATGTYELEE